jgi:diaminohydroxyphosphoribosylaminopyrimidine deaminase/5-amino-6-(5-phosphoribosylamino)uracil reductase
LNPDERFMRQALAMARVVPTASPNPRVGAVLVRDGRVSGRGAHRGAGTPHAEVLALAETEATGAGGATPYVTLEPCNFFGRTPPCAPAVIAAGVRRVVVGMEDPDVRVKGTGIAALREAGVEAEIGVLEDAARRLNPAFIHHRTTGFPLVVLKLALTLDGRLAAVDRSSRWITSSRTRVLVHEDRARSDAVLVGARTIEADDPALSVRLEGSTRQPLRVVVDSRGRVDPSARVFRSRDAPVIVATTDAASHQLQTAWKEAGAEVLVLEGNQWGVDLEQLLRALGARDILQVYCEGGASLATSLLREGLVHRLHLHLGPKMVGGDGPRIGDLGITSMAEAQEWDVRDVARVEDDVLLTLQPKG